jgi:hypothetical protein
MVSPRRPSSIDSGAAAPGLNVDRCVREHAVQWRQALERGVRNDQVWSRRQRARRDESADIEAMIAANTQTLS